MFHGYELSTRPRLVWRTVALVASVAVNAVLSMGLMMMVVVVAPALAGAHRDHHGPAGTLQPGLGQRRPARLC